MRNARIGAMLAAALVAGCAADGVREVAETEDGRFQVVATGFSARAALDAATARAQARCAADGLTAQVLARETGYRGVGADTAVIVEAPGTIGQGGGSYVAATGPDDFRAEIIARCQPG
jgi:hypothetical protein